MKISKARKKNWLSYLQIEMVAEIMSRVPADFLIKFKRVNKFWRSVITELINDPSFVAKHLSNTNKQSFNSIIYSQSCSHVDHSKTDCRGDIFSLITILNTKELDLPKRRRQKPFITEELDLPKPRHGISNKLGLWQNVLHCDGILCLVRNPNTIFMCNPILQECRVVPELEYSKYQGLGFGYDPKAKDYKLVRASFNEINRAEVYSVNNDLWKKIEMPEGMNIKTFSDRIALYCNGVCYWIVDRSSVLCFDLSDEEFHIVNFPEFDSTDKVVECFELTIWNDSLALCVCYNECSFELMLFLEIFVLGCKDKGSCSWTKERYYGPVPEFNGLISFLDEDVILMKDVDGNVVTYDWMSEEFKYVLDQDKRNWKHFSSLYEKSLVSIKRR